MLQMGTEKKFSIKLYVRIALLRHGLDKGIGKTLGKHLSLNKSVSKIIRKISISKET